MAFRVLSLFAVLVAVPAMAHAQEGAEGLAAPRRAQPARLVSPAQPERTPAQPERAPDRPASAETETPAIAPAQAVPVPPTSAGYEAARYAAPERSALSSDGPRISPAVATRLRALDGSLTNLAARGGSIVDGVLSMVTGGLSVGLGVVVHEDDTTLASYLYLWGVAGVARGVIDIALRPRAQRPAIQFGHMPMTTADEVEARLRFGESALAQIARRARLARILDSSLSITTGLLVLPIYLIPNDFSFEDPFDWFVLIGSGISVITGVINLATRSNAERRWSAYQDLRDRLERRSSVAFTGGVTPVRGGAAASLGFTF
ncbi:MAG: hypothetical protein AAF938_22230 [Myxococcota bacterium]